MASTFWKATDVDLPQNSAIVTVNGAYESSTLNTYNTQLLSSLEVAQ